MTTSGAGAAGAGDEPGGRAPAPGGLRLVQQFVNTNDREGGWDELATPAQLGVWLHQHSRWPASTEPTACQRTRAVNVREGLRQLAAQRGGPDDAELRRAVAGLDIRLLVRRGEFRLDSENRLGRALVPILDAVRTAMDDGSWARMKVCERDVCRWLFYDSSRNHSARWCTTDLCGSREKAKRAYRRHRSV